MQSEDLSTGESCAKGSVVQFMSLEVFAMGPAQSSSVAEVNLLNQYFGNILLVFLGKAAKTQSSLNSIQSGPRNVSKFKSSGLGVLMSTPPLKVKLVGCS